MSRSLLPTFLLAVAAAAQAPANYYASVDASTPARLRQTLHAVIRGHTRIPYTSTGTDTWVVLEQADQNPANASAVLDLYKNASYTKVGGGTGNYDREHSWPKSYGFPNDVVANYPYTDCHHLFLCDSVYNSTRSNRPYATSSASGSELTTLLTNGVGAGAGVYPGWSNWTDGVTIAGRWETWRDRRGDVARALMYMDVRYEGGTHPITGASEPNLVLTDDVNLIDASNTGSNEAVAYMGMLTTLLQWHVQDPVDARELRRNDVVFAYQGNRNPFIDHPEWVACLFSATCSGGGSSTPPTAPGALTATAGNAQVALDWADNTEANLSHYLVYRGARAGGPYTLIAAAEGISEWLDRTVLNQKTYYYVVKAANTLGQLSGASNEVQARPSVPLPPTNVTPWLNEFHYDNTGTDTGEFVEIAGAAGTDLTGWTIVGYNGANGLVYSTLTLTGTIPAQSNGYGTRSFPMVLQNGAPDGIALVSPTNVVVEFLSYEGAMTALGGPANGMSATAIAPSESEATPVGYSLQRQGTGNRATAFTWSPSAIVATPGQPNTGQTLR